MSFDTEFQSFAPPRMKLFFILLVLVFGKQRLGNIVARDLPGGKRILVINMMAQYITFNKAIKA